VKILGLPDDKARDYIALLSKIESSDNPKAKAKTSSASGRFQFIKSTWTGLGYRWEDVFNDALQYEAIEKFTNQNAQGLKAAGCAINFATLYGAHFLGLAGMLRIMRATPSTPIEQVTEPAQRRANPSILKGTVKDFGDWLRRKTGDDYTKRYTDSGFVSGPGVVLPPEPPKGGRRYAAILFVAICIVVAVAWAVMTKGGLNG
jgi:hypothetical protein